MSSREDNDDLTNLSWLSSGSILPQSVPGLRNFQDAATVTSTIRPPLAPTPRPQPRKKAQKKSRKWESSHSQRKKPPTPAPASKLTSSNRPLVIVETPPKTLSPPPPPLVPPNHGKYNKKRKRKKKVLVHQKIDVNKLAEHHRRLTCEVDYKNDNRCRPPYSYAALICLAMKEREEGKMTLSQIYKWIRDNFAFYRKEEKSWEVRNIKNNSRKCQ